MKSAEFKSLLAVVEHLSAAGFKVSKSKIYRDQGKGMIRVNPDGTVPETEVRAYAATLERVGGDISDLSDIHAKKTAREVESLEIKIAKQKYELEKDQGKYLPRADFELELAARAVIFETGLKHRIRSKVSEWIALVGGKADKGPDLLESMEAEIEAELSSYATTKTFQVLFLES